MVVSVNRCIPEGLISNSFQMSDKTYPNSRGCIRWPGRGSKHKIGTWKHYVNMSIDLICRRIDLG